MAGAKKPLAVKQAEEIVDRIGLPGARPARRTKKQPKQSTKGTTNPFSYNLGPIALMLLGGFVLFNGLIYNSIPLTIVGIGLGIGGLVRLVVRICESGANKPPRR